MKTTEKMILNLNFENLTKFDYDKEVVQKIVQSLLEKPEIYQNSCLNELKFSELSIDFVFCDDEFIHKINKEYRGKGIGTALMRRMLGLLKEQGFRKASLAVQKANYAVRMYEAVGFRTIDENAEEYIMVCEL